MPAFVTVIGAQRACASLVRKATLVPLAATKGCMQGALIVEGAARRLAPVAKSLPSTDFSGGRSGGMLRNSIVVRPIFGGAECAATAEYAQYVEMGTSAHVILPRNAAALHWLAQSGRGKKRTFGDVFAMRVQHPGTAPHPFMRPAYDVNRQRIIDTVGRVVVAELAKGVP